MLKKFTQFLAEAKRISMKDMQAGGRPLNAEIDGDATPSAKSKSQRETDELDALLADIDAEPSAKPKPHKPEPEIEHPAPVSDNKVKDPVVGLSCGTDVTDVKSLLGAKLYAKYMGMKAKSKGQDLDVQDFLYDELADLRSQMEDLTGSALSGAKTTERILIRKISDADLIVQNNELPMSTFAKKIHDLDITGVMNGARGTFSFVYSDDQDASVVDVLKDLGCKEKKVSGDPNIRAWYCDGAEFRAYLEPKIGYRMVGAFCVW